MDGFQIRDDYVLVWTDGACPGNGIDPDARAGLGVWWNKDHKWNVSSILHESMKQTNNEAEIMAVVVALRLAKRKKMLKLLVHTDSKYFIDCTEWVKKWQRNGWTTCAGQEVENRKSLEEYLSLLEGIEVKIKYVPAHSGDEGNEAADALARGAVARACAGKPVTKTIGVPQHLSTDVSASSVEHRAATGMKVVAKIGGFGPVVATVGSASEITFVRGCVVFKLDDVSRGRKLIVEAFGGVMTITKLVLLTVQVGGLVLDIEAAVLDDLVVPLLLGADWMESAGHLMMDRNGVVLNGQRLEPIVVVPYSPGAENAGFTSYCSVVEWC